MPKAGAATTGPRRGTTSGPFLTLGECRQGGEPFTVIVQQVARESGVEERALTVRTLVHLPRVVGRSGRVQVHQVRSELKRSARQLQDDRKAVEAIVPQGTVDLDQLRFGVVERSVASLILTRLHYLRSDRAEAVTYGLMTPDGLPVAIASVNPLTWDLVGRAVEKRFGVPRRRIWDVSRVYAFDTAPANSISLLLSKVRGALRRQSPGGAGEQIDLLVTAVDPNLGFSGSSYRASNWQQWMSVQARPYLYENQQYVSPRQLREAHQTANLESLCSQQPGVFQRSWTPLCDSLIFACSLRGPTREVPEQERPRLRR